MSQGLSLSQVFATNYSRTQLEIFQKNFVVVEKVKTQQTNSSSCVSYNIFVTSFCKEILVLFLPPLHLSAPSSPSQPYPQPILLNIAV